MERDINIDAYNEAKAAGLFKDIGLSWVLFVDGKWFNRETTDTKEEARALKPKDKAGFYVQPNANNEPVPVPTFEILRQ